MRPDHYTRLAKAQSRLVACIVNGSWQTFSNLIYDAAEDGNEYPDGEGGIIDVDNGFDSDDLAIVLLALLKEHGIV